MQFEGAPTYRFSPQPDITAYELARILSEIQVVVGGGPAVFSLLGVISFEAQVFEALGPLRRHFTRTMPPVKEHRWWRKLLG